MRKSVFTAVAINLSVFASSVAGAAPSQSREPWEKIPGVTTHLRHVDVGGTRLLAAIALPVTGRGPLEPILFTQWVSCGTVAYREGSGAREILAALARETGRALVRVERFECSELDYDTELAHYVAAYQTLLKDPLLNPRRVHVYGSSLGSTTAPLLARALEREGYDIGQVAIQGGGALTYLERMLIFDRIYLERRPKVVPRSVIHQELIDRARFHLAYLVDGTHPDAIARRSPRMAEVRKSVRGLGEKDHYGRPFAWHQQAAKKNFLAAWAELEAEVLVIYNAFDQFEGLRGHAVVAETINARRPGSAHLIVQEGVDHSNARYSTAEAAYRGEGGEPAWRETADHLVAWFRGRR